MNKEKFLYYLNEPAKLDNESLSGIAEIVGVFPFFQTAHLLLVKNLHNLENIKYNNQLKVSSAYITDRKILYQLIFSKNFEQATEAKNAPVIDESVSIDFTKSDVERSFEAVSNELVIKAALDVSSPLADISNEDLPIANDTFEGNEEMVDDPQKQETNLVHLAEIIEQQSFIENVDIQDLNKKIDATEDTCEDTNNTIYLAEDVPAEIIDSTPKDEIVVFENKDVDAKDHCVEAIEKEEVLNIHLQEELQESVEIVSPVIDIYSKDEPIIRDREFGHIETSANYEAKKEVVVEAEKKIEISEVIARKSFLNPEKETIADKILRELQSKREIMADEKAKKNIEKNIIHPERIDEIKHIEQIVEIEVEHEAAEIQASIELTRVQDSSETSSPDMKIDEVTIPQLIEDSKSLSSISEHVEEIIEEAKPDAKESIADKILRQVKERREKLLNTASPIEEPFAVVKEDTSQADIQEENSQNQESVLSQNDDSPIGKEKEIFLEVLKTDDLPIYDSLRFAKRKNLFQDENKESIADKILKQVNKFRIEKIEKKKQKSEKVEIESEHKNIPIEIKPVELLSESEDNYEFENNNGYIFIQPDSDDDISLPDELMLGELMIDTENSIDAAALTEQYIAEERAANATVVEENSGEIFEHSQAELPLDLNAITTAFSEIVTSQLDRIVDEKLEKFTLESKTQMQIMLHSLQDELTKISESTKEILNKPDNEIVEFDFQNVSIEQEFAEENEDGSEGEELFEFEKNRPVDFLLQETKKQKEATVLPVIESTASKYSNLNGSLIDKFLRGEHKIIPAEPTSNIKESSKQSIEESEECISETLAKIYMKQGHYSKAILAFRKLSLKYPEKNIYFAAQIEKVKKLINE